MKAMSALRSFCLWMLMLSLPLQGYAAASMRWCGSVQGVPAAAAALPHLQQAGTHDHARHSVPSDHSAHDTLSHKCALCASCCHAMALQAFFIPLEFGPLAHAGPAEPLVLIQAMPLRVPEKPPRA